MLTLLAAVMSALSLLLQWLIYKKSQRGSLTADQKNRINHALFQMEQVKAAAAELGCAPQSDPLHATMYSGDDLFPGD